MTRGLASDTGGADPDVVSVDNKSNVQAIRYPAAEPATRI